MELATLCGATAPDGAADARIDDHAKVVIDSRQVAPGDLFVALKGPHHDAHRFLNDVWRSGAAAAIVDREVPVPEGRWALQVEDTEAALRRLAAGYRSGFDIPVAAITGSCGKTTTKEMVRQILARDRHALITQGNLNNQIGLPLTLLGLRPEHDLCVVEMGVNHPGEIDELCALSAPTVGLVTGIGAAHLEGLGDAEGVAREKGRLFAALGAGGTAVVNLDDPRVVDQAEQYPCGRRITYTSHPETDADVSVTLVEEVGEGANAALGVAGISVPIRIFSAAPYQLQNAAAAAALCHALGVAAEAIAAGLAAFSPLPMRGQEVLLKSGARVIDDTYNANPVSMMAALSALAAIDTPGRRIAVLGDMLELGEGAAGLHRELGQHIPELGISKLICVGTLAREIATAAQGLDEVHTVERPDAALPLLNDLRDGDVVLVKGSRGLAMETIVQHLTHPSDVEAVA